MEVPAGSTVRGLVARFDMPTSDLGQDSLRYMRLGLHYTTSFDMEVEGRDVKAVMSRILREEDGHIWVLGFIDLAEKNNWVTLRALQRSGRLSEALRAALDKYGRPHFANFAENVRAGLSEQISEFVEQACA
jgi:hypothetical protein